MLRARAPRGETLWVDSLAGGPCPHAGSRGNGLGFLYCHAAFVASAVEGQDTETVLRLYNLSRDNLYQMRKRLTTELQETVSEVLAEITAGERRSHWIWYVFPQLKGLGMSWTSEFYGIANLDEARAC